MPITTTIFLAVERQGRAGPRVVGTGSTPDTARLSARNRELAAEEELRAQRVPGTRGYGEIHATCAALPVVRVAVEGSPEALLALAGLIPGADWLRHTVGDRAATLAAARRWGGAGETDDGGAA